MGNIAQNLLDTAAREGCRPALRMGDAVLTYDQLIDAVGRVAAGLEARGVMPGDRVGMVLPNVLSFPVVYYGALMAGAAVVPMNPLLKEREIHYNLRDSGARLVVAAETSAQAALAAAGAGGIEAVAVDGVRPDALMAAHATTNPTVRSDDDVAAILYTSGTTGPPKGAELTHGNLSGNARTTAQTLLDSDAGRRRHGLPAAVPRLRAHLRAQRVGAVRRQHDAASALRRGGRLVAHRAGQGHNLRGRPDDVLEDAARAQRGRRRPHPPAAVCLGRRGPAGRGDALVRGDVRVRRPRGLRAVRDLAGRHVQPSARHEQGRQHRHTDRRCRGAPGGRATAGMSRVARSARWPSAART